MSVVPPTSGAAAGAMYELPLLAGHTSSSAQAVNDAGDVVGLSLDANENGYLVRWGADGTLTPLQAVEGGTGGHAVKIVDDGTVAGFTDAPDGVRHAARWSAAGVLTRLEEPPGYTRGEAQDINNSRVAVGQLSTESRTLPVRWGPDGRATALRLPPRALGGAATAINDRGTVIGRATDTNGIWKAVRAPRGGTFEALPSQEPGARTVSANNADVVVANVKDRSLRWTGTGTGTGAGTGPGVTELQPLRGTARTFVRGINDRGTSVGTSDPFAVTWDAQGTPTALPVPAGFDRADPVAINATGVVAGNVGSSRTWPARWRAVVWR
ncbi:hypothetical protein [Streptomyces sp. NPDC059552]|uniref:hypothetical protein n=1 Tax=Streptomyces sp. NPDC059552 TaxID=3346862 RepID=UPI00369338CA